MVDVVLMEWALSPPGPPLLEKLRALLPMVPPKTSLLPLLPVEFTTETFTGPIPLPDNLGEDDRSIRVALTSGQS